MPITKWSSIVVGAVMLVMVILPAPYGLLLRSTVAGETNVSIRRLIEDGILSVNREVAIAKHAGSYQHWRGTM